MRNSMALGMLSNFRTWVWCVSLSHRPICCSSHSSSTMICRLRHRRLHFIVHIASSLPGCPCTRMRACTANFAVLVFVANPDVVIRSWSCGALSTAPKTEEIHIANRRASPITRSTLEHDLMADLTYLLASSPARRHAANLGQIAVAAALRGSQDSSLLFHPATTFDPF